MKEKALTILVDNEVRDLIIELDTKTERWTITDGANTGIGLSFNDSLESYKRKCIGLGGIAIGRNAVANGAAAMAFGAVSSYDQAFRAADLRQRQAHDNALRRQQTDSAASQGSGNPIFDMLGVGLSSVPK